MRRLFVSPISKQNKKLGFSHVESGKRDTSILVLKNRDEWQVCSSGASYRHFFPDKKNSQIATLRFFSHESKKKSGGRPSLLQMNAREEVAFEEKKRSGIFVILRS